VHVLSWDKSEWVLVRYDYPSFRPTAPCALKHGGPVVIDPSGSDLYVCDYSSRHDASPEARFARYRLADLRPQPATAVENRPLGVCAIPVKAALGLGCTTVLAGDGRYLFFLEGKFRDKYWDKEFTQLIADGTLHRVDTTTMKCDRQMRIPLATGRLAISPDGTSVYVVADRQQASAAIWDIDPVRFVVRRELRPSKAAINHIQCTASGFLVLSGVEEYAHQFHSRRVRLLAPDGTEHKPRLTARSRLAPLVTDGRLLVTRKEFGTLELWDLEGELKTMRARCLGELKADTAALSPDGRVLLLPDGRVYWLAGAGDPPMVDPASKWKS
jgi:hypothetical protein